MSEIGEGGGVVIRDLSRAERVERVERCGATVRIKDEKMGLTNIATPTFREYWLFKLISRALFYICILPHICFKVNTDYMSDFDKF